MADKKPPKQKPRTPSDLKNLAKKGGSMMKKTVVKKAFGGSSMSGGVEAMRMLNADNPRKRAKRQARQRKQLRNQKRTKGCSRKPMFGSSSSASGDMC